LRGQGLQSHLVHIAYLPSRVNDRQIHNLIYSPVLGELMCNECGVNVSK
jgi:hypothetical protein